MKKKNILISWITASVFLVFSTVSAQSLLIKSPGNHQDIQAAIQDAVNKAGNGTQIILPEGEFILNKSVVINKFISFKGQGLKKTILYTPESVPDSILRKSGRQNMFVFNIKSNLPSKIIIADIGFRSKKPSVVRGDGGSRAGSTGISLIQCVDFVIERCRFENFGNAGISVEHEDTLARGLIRKNEFYYNAGAGLGYGVVIYGKSKEWVIDPKFGSSNFIFVEDNNFDSHRHSIAAGGCALYVFRYNTVLNNIFADGGHAIDTHEARPGDGSIYGTRAVEIYNNKLLNTTYTYGLAISKGVKIKAASLETAGIAIRNGEAVVFNNEVRGYQYAASMSNWYFGGTAQPYPVKYGPGYLSGIKFGPEHRGTALPQGEGDVFFWDNKNYPFLEDAADSSSGFHNFEPEWWKEGRDYHLVPKPGYKPYPYPYPVKNN